MFQLTARIVSAAAAFIYPAYASYKSLSQRPALEADLERWLMYWSVLGCTVAIESLAEFLLSWIPFYYTIKMLFLLYLVLPQTQGASHVYTTHLRPFFRAHEAQIDEALAQLRARAYRFVQERLRALWGAVQAQPQPQQQQQAVEGTATATRGALGALWRTYGARILASGAAFVVAPAPAPAPTPTPAPEPDVAERRRRLQAELAALDRVGAGVRERTTSGSGSARFEEVEVPSDVEGYDVGGQSADNGSSARSWFAWSRSVSGYEKVKSE